MKSGIELSVKLSRQRVGLTLSKADIPRSPPLQTSSSYSPMGVKNNGVKKLESEPPYQTS